MGKIRSDVLYPTGHMNAVQQTQCLHRFSWSTANHIEGCLGSSLTNRGEYVSGKPYHAVNVRPVVHRPGEHNGFLVCRVRIRIYTRGGEIVGIDTVGVPVHSVGHSWGDLAEIGRLSCGNK